MDLYKNIKYSRKAEKKSKETNAKLTVKNFQ